jgi:hypothetical protein
LNYSYGFAKLELLRVVLKQTNGNVMEPANAESPRSRRVSRAVIWAAVFGVVCAATLVLLIPILVKRGSDVQKNQVQPAITLKGNKLVLEGLAPSEIDLSGLVQEVKDQVKHEVSQPLVTNVYNAYNTFTGDTIVQGGGGDTTGPQTLSLSGNVLSISEGNRVALPESQDQTVGNEILDVTADSGLLRVGSGTTLDPYKVSLQICGDGEILKSAGGNWNCAADAGGASYNAGNGLQLIGATFSVASPTCTGTNKLQWTGSAFSCTADLNTTYSAGTGIGISGTTINNTGVLSVGGSGPITSSGGQNPSLNFVNGSANGQFWQWNGSAWVLASLPAEQDAVVGNEVLNVTGVNSGLVRSGAGTAVSPYTIAANVGNGLTLLSNAITINSPTCSGTDKLQWNGSAFVCAPDVDTNTTYTAGSGLSLAGTSFSVNSPTCAGTDKLQWTGSAFVCSVDVNTDQQTLSWDNGTRTLSILNGNSVVIPDADTNTTYSALTNGGLQLVGTQFGLQPCTSGQVLKAQATSGQWACANDTDTNTTYSAGTGLSLVGTTFNNTGVLDVTGSGPITSSGGQNPDVAFADGTTNGQFWQWDGDSWELALLPSEQDAVIGNEVTNVTGSNSGLVRSGAGTSVNPYTLAANIGNGIQITSNTIAINSPTCSGTNKLQWTGTAFICTADIDTDTNTTYSAGNGLSLVGTTFNVSSPTCSGTDKLQWNGTAFVCSADVDTDTDAQTLSFDNGTRTLSISNGNSVVIPDDNTTYSALTNGGLRLVGTQFALKTCTSGQVLKAQATAGEWDCAADTDTNTTYSAGTGLSLVGTTFNNTGTLNVTASGALTSSGGQNPDVAFADGTANGQFWQWDGDSWELATLPAEQDAIVGNEVTNVTGSSSGLVRSGAGTTVNPYTLAANVGNGIQITSNAIAINSPTCSGTDKLQWTGTVFICSADVDTNTTYSAGNGLSLVGTSFSVNGPTCAGTDKLQWNGTAFICSTDVDAQTLSWNSGTRTLSISNGNSVVIGDSDTTYSALTNGGLRLVGMQFALKSCTSGQVLKAQATAGEWDCAADTDTNTTYSAGTGLSLVGTTFNNTGVLSVTGSGALTSSGGQNPNIAFADGTTNGQFWQWNGTAWALATLPTDGDSITGNEVTNVTGGNSGLVRSGSGTAVSPYTLAANVGNGLQIVSNAIAINSPTCAGTTKLQWTGTAFVCSTDVDTDTTNFTIADATTNQSVSAAQTVTFLGDSATKLKVVLGGTRQLTFSLDTVGASNGQVLTYNGSALAWQTPTTYAPSSCSATSSYICQNGNTYGATATIGTTDAQALSFITNNTQKMTILSNGNVGIGGTPTEKLDVNGNINIPTTSSTAGTIKQNGVLFMHSFGDGDFFAGTSSGNLTTTGFDNVGVGANTLQALTDGFYNTAVGSQALVANTDGIYNTGLGYSVLGANVGGYYNTGAGSRALNDNDEGFYNAAFGSDALFSNTTGSANTALGVGALSSNLTGTGNVGVGEYAGFGNITDGEVVSGSNNTFLGIDSSFSSATEYSNATAVGAFSVVGNNNALSLGCISGVNSCPARVRVGIGVANPQNMLHIDGGTAQAALAQFTGNATTGQTSGDGFAVGIDSVGTAFVQQREAAPLVFYTSNTLNMVLDTNGRLGISNNAPGFLLHVGSASTTTGTSVARFQNAGGTCTITPSTAATISCTSDERLKKNIEDYNDALEVVKKLDAKEFNMKAEADGARKQVGFLAQELEKVLPELVLTDQDGYKSIGYSGLVPILSEAVKEQQIEIEKLQANMLSGGIVTKDTNFKAKAIFEGPVAFKGGATFDGDVDITGKITLSKDQTSSVVLPKGQKSVEIRFGGSYKQLPHITATPREFFASGLTQYRVTNVTQQSFTIELSQAQRKDVQFDWHAFP